ncbi:aspartate carbamoyltransferase catalytic subunit [Bacillus horti]|uniref:Aspartate carbamoyltransferase n=1 Tax=Caldalkalibacillus horti TaxID=77523 RepID=A0ABT9VX45_9BACI|nr:aspartate carbamoyltransferase catalytic subunit [Bacillus horti]MDQ0165564.1 aspartate carbamoyltransferase catalytic subunit [Bacillus horti]
MNKHLLGLKDLGAEDLLSILKRAEQFTHSDQESHLNVVVHKGTFVTNLFFENSTRTRFSFEVAQKRLGLNVLNFQESVSSAQKGESLYDTLKTLESMGVKAAVIRHSQNGILKQLESGLNLNLVNAGIGNEEHPTQALLDMLTMKQEFGSLQGLKVAIIGDLQHSRVLRSNYYGLTKLGASLILSGPEEYKPVDQEILGGCTWLPMDDAIVEADVVMMLRIQLERHREQAVGISQTEYHQKYGLTEQRSKFMKKEAIIMHPAPFNRDVEIASSLIESPKSRIFKQVTNGVAIRMAVMERVLCSTVDEQGTNSKIKMAN